MRVGADRARPLLWGIAAWMGGAVLGAVAQAAEPASTSDAAPASLPAAAASVPAPPASATMASTPASHEPSPVPPSRPAFEGALGPVGNWSRESRSVDLKPGFYLRYKRLSVSNASSFAIRRNDDVFRGLGLDMVNNDKLQFNVGLRLDRGGRISDNPSLVGHDEVDSTVRLRASVTYRLTPRWSLGAGWNADILGHGGGQVADLGVSREQTLGPRLHWAVSTNLSAANGQFQRSYFGIDATQSALSGLPVYKPSSGLLNASVGTSLRMEINPSWVAFAGVSAVRRLGPQLDSPLVTWSSNWGVNGGIARRF